jgi:hypothetical protein
MKNRVILLIALFGCCGIWSCNDDELTDTKESWLTPEQIEKNTIVLDSAFSLTIKAIGSADKIKKLAKAADSEEDFIRQMNLLTKDVFDESIEVAWKVKSEPYRNTEYDAARLLSFNLNDQLTDPLRSYASAIEEDAASHGGHEEQIEIHGVFLYADVVAALEGFELIMDHGNPDALDDAIDDFSAEPQSPVLIGLLLPAVQAAREARRQHGRDLHDYVMIDRIITGDQTAILRQQQKAAGYLGALDLLASGDYKKDDDIFISVAATRAIYLNTAAQLWHQAWAAYH